MKKMSGLLRRAGALALSLLMLAGTMNLGMIVPADAAEDAVVLPDSIAYYGDRSRCQMTAEQAEEIARFLEYYEPEEAYGEMFTRQQCSAVLCDGDNCGLPVLMILCSSHDFLVSIDLCTWNNGTLVKSLTLYNVDHSEYIVFGKNENGGYSWEQDGADPDYLNSEIFTVKNGVLSDGIAYRGGVYNWDEYMTNGDARLWSVWKNGSALGGTYTDEQYEEMRQQDGGVVGEGTDIYADIGASLSAMSSALRAYAAELQYRDKSPAEILAALPYCGDRSECRMTFQQAEAYAEALQEQYEEQVAELQGQSDLISEAVLFDTGAGIPAMLLATIPKKAGGSSDTRMYVWEYVGGQVLRRDDLGGRQAILYQNYIELWQRLMAQNEVYPYQNGRISDDPVWAGNTLSGYSYTDPNGKVTTYTLEDGVSSDDLIPKGEILFDIDMWFGSTPGGMEAPMTISLLRAYAEAAKMPVYTFPLLEEGDPMYAKVAGAVTGEIEAVYRLTGDLGYVLFRDGQGQLTGIAVRGSRVQGSEIWTAGVPATPMTQEELSALANQLETAPNMVLDFTQAASYTGAGDLTAYLRDRLDNMDGLAPNDAAKAELASFIESAITAIASGSVSGRNNRLKLTSKLAGEPAERARSAWEEAEKLLADSGVALNKELISTVRVLWQDMDWSEPGRFILDPSLAETLENCALRLLLADGQHYVELSGGELKTLTGQYGSMEVQVSQTGENIYAITFLDGEGNVLERLPEAVTVGLPAGSMTSTVMVSYAGGNDNWGGQYDEVNGAITFETAYSGQYEVLENDIQIDDIGDLSEESRTAIRFLVSKGYLGLEGSSFNPGGSLTRYQFTKALVGMFFALDRELTTSFLDVPADSEFYPYVASAEARRIVLGTDGNTFAGESNMTVEQMLAVAARTLMDQKGYVPPDEAEAYLGAFTDGASVSEWARQQAALSVRENLVDRGGELRPQAEITREQAASILYRLFLRLYEVSPVVSEPPQAGEEPPEVSEPSPSDGEAASDGRSPVIMYVVIGAIAVVAAAAGCGAFLLVKKRANAPKSVPGSAPEPRPGEASTPSAHTGPHFCPHCGTPLPPDSAFCQECGKPLTGPAESDPASRQ